MLFKRYKPDDETPAHPGRTRALDGYAAALAMEAIASDIVVGHRTIESAVDGDARATLEVVAAAAAAAGRVAGASASGLRAAAMVDSLADLHPSLYAAAGKRLTTVYHLTCHAMTRHAGSLGGGHDDYFAVADAGLFQFFARGAQEAADYALVARAVAERALTPGIVAQDYYRTSHSVQVLALPEVALVDEYLGRPGDIIDAPTPAQEVLFGKSRRRVPRLLDADHPIGMGGFQDSESYFKALAAQRIYFAGHLRDIISSEFARFGELTGRRYAEALGYRVEDADVVVIAQGAVVDELEAVADYLRDNEKLKVGVVDLAVFRPFPGAALARLLRGRRAVAVLERTDRPLADAPPLTAEIRGAIDRAVENGSAGEAVHAGYDAWRPADRPRVVTRVYGAGGELPTFADLVAVCRDLASKSPRSLAYLGLGEDATIRRFPHLHSLQQALNRDYPERNDIVLPAADAEAPVAPGHAVRLYSLSVQGGLFAGNLFAQSLAEDAGAVVRTFPQGGAEAGAHTATLTLAHSDGGDSPRHRPDKVDTVLVVGGKLVEDVSSRDDLSEAGTLIVETDRTAEVWWRSLSRRTGRWIQDRKLRVVTIDASRIAEETASKPSTVDQLAIWALLGAYASLRLPPERVDSLVDGIRARLARAFGDAHYLVDDVTGAMRRGANDIADVDWSSFTTDELAAASDGEPPWTVADSPAWDPTVFDATRFWHSVGYLYDTGQADRALADPYLATGAIPGRSSAFRDNSPYRLRVPRWLPENCTGCGDCWSRCPDSAMPPTIHNVTSILSASMTAAEQAGAGLVQMRRFADHLATQAYKLMAGDGMHQYLRAGALFDAAFDRLIDKLGLDDDKQAALRAEFAQVRTHCEHYPIAKTDLFFNAPHAESKGSGMALTIALNPLACTGCGVCVDVCPDGALERIRQTPELIAERHGNRNFQLTLPAVDRGDIDRFVAAAGTDVHRLLSRDTYHTLVGGDGSFPGNGAKTAVHLAAAAVESSMAPRYEKHVTRLAALIERLEGKIQGDVSGVLKINDFDDFSRRLDRLKSETLSPDDLAGAVGDESGGRTIDPERLRRLTRVHDGLVEQKRLYESGATGTGRARVLMTVDTDAVRLWAGTYPYNPLPFPWVCHVPGDGVDVALGVCEGVTRRITEEAVLCRMAELELDDAYDAAVHDAGFAGFGVDDLDDTERALIPPVLVISEAGRATLDSAAALLLRPVRVALLLLDSSGAAPGAAAMESSLVSMARDNDRATVVQSSTGTPAHLMRGVLEGVERGGPMLIHAFAPDPIKSGVASEKTAAQARLAVESRAFPLFIASGGSVTTEGNPAADSDWVARMLGFREPSGAESRLETQVTPADWAVNEARFQRHFRVIPKGKLGGNMVPLVDYLARDEDGREGLEPYIHFVGSDRRHLIAVVSEEMARAAASRAGVWKWLRALASSPPPAIVEQPAAPAPVAPPPPPAAADASVHEALTRRLLQLSGFSDDPEFFKRSLREFVVERNVAATSRDADNDGPVNH